MIECTDLGRTFTTYKKHPGVFGSVKSFFNREYITKPAVETFNLSIAAGEIVGLLGPNGAGKTTLMKLFTGIIFPSSGELTVLGFMPSERRYEFRKKIALVMGQKSQLWWDIPAFDSFELLKSYYEIPNPVFKDKLGYLSELLQVKNLLHVHLRKLSLGERMKMELLASLLHQPQVMFLDEPTIGLDVVAQGSVRQFLTQYHRDFNPTIILTSHYMADVEALCERIVLIFDGQKKFDGDLKKFERILGSDRYATFVFSERVPTDHVLFAGLDATWNEGCTKVELRIPIVRLREVSSFILRDLPVSDFLTDKTPIERVMHSVLTDPNLMAEPA